MSFLETRSIESLELIHFVITELPPNHSVPLQTVAQQVVPEILADRRELAARVRGTRSEWQTSRTAANHRAQEYDLEMLELTDSTAMGSKIIRGT